MNKLLNLISKLVDALNYLKIMVSPILLGAFIGVIVYINQPDTTGLIIAFLIVTLGLIGGILLANWAKRKTGTTEFMSRINASPDIDEALSKKIPGK